MRSKFRTLALVPCLCLWFGVSASAQVSGQSGTARSTSAPPQERTVGDYLTAGSIEAGYRFEDVRGDQYQTPQGTIGNYVGMYNTLENLHEGPRIFAGQLTMRSPARTGVLFDQLSFSSFGWGGDPQTVARISMSKSRWYNFAATWRHNKNYFDYNILGNPLNPTNSNLNQLVYESTQAFYTARRMTDVALTLFPASKISVRLGYDRVRGEGPSLTSFHMPMGTDIAPLQEVNYTTDGYRAGIDLKFPRTTFSFDGVYRHFKNDTFVTDTRFPGTLGGRPVDFGVSFNFLPLPPVAVTSAYPCNPAVAYTAVCNLAFSHFRQDRVRSDIPLVQFAFQSQYFNRLDLSGRGIYSWTDYDAVFTQNWTGFTRQRLAEEYRHTPTAHRAAREADLGATFHLTDSIRLNNSFHWERSSWSSTGFVSDVSFYCPAFGASAAPTCGVQTGTSALTPLTSPLITRRATALVDSRDMILDILQNQSELQFDLSRHVGATFGYRYSTRDVERLGEEFDADPNDPERPLPIEEGVGGSDEWTIPGHTGLGALWFQPSDKVRISADGEWTYFGIEQRSSGTDVPRFYPTLETGVDGFTTFTRITPRHEWQLRLRGTVKPHRYVTLTGSVSNLEQRNDLQSIDYKMHNRNGGFTADIAPSERWAFDVGYNYQDFVQDANECYASNPNVNPLATPCNLTGVNTSLLTGYLGTLGIYRQQTHVGTAVIRLKPARRITLALGYSIVATDGEWTQTNPFNPAGPIDFNYHRPLAALEVEMARGLALKGTYNYYEYNEKGQQPGPTLKRDFRANLGTIGVRWSF